MLKQPVLTACFGLVMAASIADCEEWTQFRGPDYGRTSEARIAPFWSSDTVAWKTPLPGHGASSPVLFDNRIYVTAYTGYGIDKKAPGSEDDLQRHLLCIRPADGTVIWEKTIPTTSSKNPFTTWAVSLHGYASSTPAVDATGIYAFFGATGVLAFNPEGEELWRTNCGTGTHPFGAGSSPVLYKNLVIINASVESGDLIALSKSDGSEVWRQPGIEASWNTPVIYEANNGARELALTIKGKILAFDPDTGEPRWTCDGIPDYICPSIIVQDGILYVIGGRTNKTIAIRPGGSGDVTESHTVWDIAKGSNVSSPVYHDGHLYWANDKRGIIYCANAATGEVQYEQRLDPSPGLIYASPLLANGRLYYVSRENGIYVVAADPEFELLHHTQLKGDDSAFNASPVPLRGGAVLLRSHKYLYRMRPAN